MFNTIITSPITIVPFALCLVCAAILGVLTSVVFNYGTKHSSYFSVTIALLPVIFSIVVMLINGSIGTAVAVAGSFALVRFRSIPGTAKELAAVFTAMAIGLCTGMGYLGIAVCFFVLIALMVLVMKALHFGETRNEKMLRISVPENYDYNELFREVFEKYSIKASMDSVKTTNMGSVFTVTYRIVLKDDQIPKPFLDDLRVRNGNLSIIIGNVEEIRSL